MALVVFMRGVNVGGHKTFKPSALARELAELDVVNVGAAGTLVVRTNIAQAKLRDELLRRMPFKAELMICPARELLLLAESPHELQTRSCRNAKPFVSVMAKRPVSVPRLPIDQPPTAAWQVRITAVTGRFALSMQRPGPSSTVYANEVVERAFNIAATTRSWNTLLSVCRTLQL